MGRDTSHKMKCFFLEESSKSVWGAMFARLWYLCKDIIFSTAYEILLGLVIKANWTVGHLWIKCKDYFFMVMYVFSTNVLINI